MFIDLVKLTVKSGKGGDGMVAFRREKFVPMGGPAGGSGGNGADVIFIGDEGLSTLLDLRYNKILKASDGENGQSKSMDGKNAASLYVKVPVGTTIYNEATNETIGDITEDKQEVIVAKGGRGGRGNVKFATSRNPAPEICEKGEPGEAVDLRIELRVLADVGLVGFPSVGKSTLISIVSKARPKIAEYHFTTIKPNLGVVRAGDKSFVMADLPGLIEGASLGAGLGYQFLRHIERTRVIIHVIDISESEGRDCIQDYEKINNELRSFNPLLMERPQIICANKADLPGSDKNYEKLRKYVPDKVDIVKVSCITKENIDKLLYKTSELLEKAKAIDFKKQVKKASEVEYNFEAKEEPFTITLADDNVFEVKGPVIEKIARRTDFTKEQSIRKFSIQMRQLGIDAALRKLGVKNGDTVRIIDFEFEFID